MRDRLYDEPSMVSAEKGEVQIDGPDGIAIAMTPEAAAETSERLLAGAAQAKRQLSEYRRPRRGAQGTGIRLRALPDC